MNPGTRERGVLAEAKAEFDRRADECRRGPHSPRSREFGAAKLAGCVWAYEEAAAFLATLTPSEDTRCYRCDDGRYDPCDRPTCPRKPSEGSGAPLPEAGELDWQYEHHMEQCAHGGTLMRIDRLVSALREINGHIGASPANATEQCIREVVERELERGDADEAARIRSEHATAQPLPEGEKCEPIFNARIVSYEPVTVMEFDVGGEWVRYVPATEIQGWLYDRMKVFQALGDSHAASVLMETADQLPRAVIEEPTDA